MNLNPAHLHIMLNHIPVFGSLFAALLIAWGLLRKSEDVLRLGLALAVVVGVATWGVQLTGEPAENVVEHLADVSRRMIHAHEEAADWATYMIAAAGVVALVALLMVRRRHRAGRGLSILALVISLVGFAAASRAALLGGEIRHPEARPDFVTPAKSGAREGGERPGGD
jgi:MYXO-CTERM domain-containing protein